MPFLIPATHTDGVKNAINKFQTGKRDAASQYILISCNENKKQEKITLIILEENDKK